MSEKQIKAKKKEKSEGKTTGKLVKSKKKMTDKLVKIDQKLIVPEKCTFTKTSLILDESISEDDFIKLGDVLWKMKEGIPWWIGDLCNFGEDEGKGLNHVRSLYSDGTIKNAMWVCRRIEPSRRREELKFGQHQVVTPLPTEEQDRWLEIAVCNRLTVKQLRNEIKREKLKSMEKKDEDYSAPIHYQGGVYNLAEFLKFCIDDVKKLTKKISALDNTLSYVGYSHLLSPDYVKKNLEKEKFIESCRILLEQLKFLLGENIND